MLMHAAVVLFFLVVIFVLAICLLTPTIETLKQPKTKKKVIELSCDGVLSRWMVKNNWGAFTCPLPFFVLIFYWVSDSPVEPLDPYVRIHEFVHVKQDERNACFLVSWVKYGWELLMEWRLYGSMFTAYEHNKYEVEAYAIEQDALDGKTPMPDWAT